MGVNAEIRRKRRSLSVIHADDEGVVLRTTGLLPGRRSDSVGDVTSEPSQRTFCEKGSKQKDEKLQSIDFFLIHILLKITKILGFRLERKFQKLLV